MVSSAQNSSGLNVQYHQQSFVGCLISVAVDVMYGSCETMVTLPLLYYWCGGIWYLLEMCEIRELSNTEC